MEVILHFARPLAASLLPATCCASRRPLPPRLCYNPLSFYARSLCRVISLPLLPYQALLCRRSRYGCCWQCHEEMWRDKRARTLYICIRSLWLWLWLCCFGFIVVVVVVVDPSTPLLSACCRYVGSRACACRSSNLLDGWRYE
jgi:hypothetical protein